MLDKLEAIKARFDELGLPLPTRKLNNKKFSSSAKNTAAWENYLAQKTICGAGWCPVQSA